MSHIDISERDIPGKAYLWVCLCPEESGDLRTTPLGTVHCERHAATKLASLIKADLNCCLYFDDQNDPEIADKGEYFNPKPLRPELLK